MQRIPVAIAAAQLGTAAAALYTAPAGTVSTINSFSLTNTSASPVSVTMYRVPNGGAAAAGNCVMSAFSLAAGQTYVPNQLIGLHLSAGMTLQALASAGGAVTGAGGVYETSGS